MQDIIDIVNYYIFLYYRLTRDNRIVMGGGDVSFGFGADLNRDLNDKVFRHLENHVKAVFPQLKGIGFTHRWGGPVSVTLDMASAIGSLGEDKKAVFSLGCIGHGVSMTTLNGRTVAELICGRKTSRTELFFVGRKIFLWPSEAISFGAAHAIREFMRLEDRLYYK